MTQPRQERNIYIVPSTNSPRALLRSKESKRRDANSAVCFHVPERHRAVTSDAWLLATPGGRYDDPFGTPRRRVDSPVAHASGHPETIDEPAAGGGTLLAAQLDAMFAALWAFVPRGRRPFGETTTRCPQHYGGLPVNTPHLYLRMSEYTEPDYSVLLRPQRRAAARADHYFVRYALETARLRHQATLLVANPPTAIGAALPTSATTSALAAPDSAIAPRERFRALQRRAYYNRRHGESWHELYMEADALEDSWHAQWAQQLQEHVPSVDGVGFVCGEVMMITMNATAYLQDGRRVLEMAPHVRHLHLTNARPYLRDVLRRSPLDRIVSLDLRSNGLSDEDIAVLAKSASVRHLRWLSLAFNNLGVSSLEQIAKSEHLLLLEALDFDGNRVLSPADVVAYDGVSGVSLGPRRTDLGLRLEALASRSLPWLRRHSGGIPLPEDVW